MTTTAEMLRNVPYVTSREGEEPDPWSRLTVGLGPDLSMGLAYQDETADDRGPRGELWERFRQSLDTFGQPTGRPKWRLVHPVRQRKAMRFLRCQVRACPAKLSSGGYLFLETADEKPREPGQPVRTGQPPVCLEHAHLAVSLCPRLSKGHVAFLARKAPLWGVIGTRYRFGSLGLTPLPAEEQLPMPYGHPQLGWFLASQLVRELTEYDVVSLDDLKPVARR
ncbi:hypothetical protein [Streptomyces rubradiris]|uniref:Uncharacterized protein n=1 Tax=Streptomyces rubradiris TaxID=285531 RepID=A0ABQ3RDE9_STRRR|nr:hypothetical protein [Streptomyces rubradiris]GHG95387.1 hypothetical protein GCM10018792_06140 [Streptomyces rubradiris]GHI53877.1 hypothetical protein Srubr_37230 [Streptomyces rubradiris]